MVSMAQPSESTQIRYSFCFLYPSNMSGIRSSPLLYATAYYRNWYQ